MILEIKKLILATTDLQEESWDDEKKAYRLTIDESSILAANLLGISNKEFVEMIDFILSLNCNDMLLWAGDYDDRKPEVSIPDDFVFPLFCP